ncbi:iron-containing alcohol dehydrogenase [Pseudoruegeria sp. SK021]|uniref:iron-containing alcohol dehydrogenase n=1 Tax=Pseudoruegeria sp. SK021 TaxID=1933035 RepID=UPI000A2348BB|nr:iron-containing alcohol dehydrogenase [Pseudoruegeria sp. SK021]OSP53937.1 hypothetical protein BV911_15150 [Pseudoruegeria sp. SK021]
MTLITFPLRAHFADGVLEEALRSELETHGYRAPLVLADAGLTNSSFTERVYSGLPRCSRPIHYPIDTRASAQTIRSDLAALLHRKSADVILAYGSARAISVGRKIRRETRTDGRAREAKDPALALFAVPGIDGLPGHSRAQQTETQSSTDLHVKSGLPSILICDPTVTLGADLSQSASAAVATLVRCLEAYLSPAFNPPADGMALDGLNRVAQSLHLLFGDERIEVRRDLMAASLNAVLAQQKGIGPTQIIGDALIAASAQGLDAGAAARLLVPGVLRAQHGSGDRSRPLRRIMGLDAETDLATGLGVFLQDLPLAVSLSELGLTRADLARAARSLSGSGTLDAINGAGCALSIMQAVF